jgi:RNA polymerase subunit RPABC4/transcription elongation factor Spt4
MASRTCLICTRTTEGAPSTCPHCGEASWSDVVALLEQVEGLLKSDEVEITDEVVTQVETPAPKKRSKK